MKIYCLDTEIYRDRDKLTEILLKLTCKFYVYAVEINDDKGAFCQHNLDNVTMNHFYEIIDRRIVDGPKVDFYIVSSADTYIEADREINSIKCIYVGDDGRTIKVQKDLDH